MTPLKRLASVRVSNVDKKAVASEQPVRLCNYTDVYYRDSIEADQEFMVATATRDQISRFRLRVGDVIITKDSETADDIGVATYVRTSAADLICGYHLAMIRADPKRIDGRFLYWYMCSQVARDQLSLSATGVTRFGLRTESISAAQIPDLPLPRQRAIADFLGAETGRIDALITKKQRLSDLIGERFRAVVSGRVGSARIAPFARNGPGVDEGEIPRLRRYLSSIEYGIGQASSSSGAVGVLGMGDLDDNGRVGGEPSGYVDDVDPRLLLASGDLLFNRTNSREKVGKVGIVTGLNGPTTFASYLVRLGLTDLASARYLNYLLNSDEALGLARSIALPSIGQANLNPSRYSEIRVALPSRVQQEMAVSELDQQRERCDALRRRLGRQIYLLHEHRQALITAAVTGELSIPGGA